MRIIAGTYRGRLLLPPASDTTRPITDRVKQSLFDILAPVIEGARVYDCFAGTGSMGLESLSRGAIHATFFEQDRSARQRLNDNISTLNVKAHSTIIPGSLFDYFKRQTSTTVKVDLVFFDPPYRMILEIPDTLRQSIDVIASGHLAESGSLILRHDASHVITVPALHLYDERTYGGMTLKFYRLPTKPSEKGIESG